MNISNRLRDLALLQSLAVVMLLGSCESTPKPTKPRASAPLSQAVLRVGMAETAPPITFAEDGSNKGIEMDCARKLAKALRRKLKIVSMHWPNLTYELANRRIDIIMAGMTITKQRRRQVAFADPYLSIGQQALIRRDSQATFGTSEKILATRRRVGVEENSTGEQFANGNLNNAKVIAYPTLAAAAAALINEKLDVVIHDSPCVQWMASRNKDDLVAVEGLFTDEQLAWAVHKEDTELRKTVNRVLIQWKESGRLDQIIRRWIPASP